nr:hypothetical protein [Burkholderiaceae bacterium]
LGHLDGRSACLTVERFDNGACPAAGAEPMAALGRKPGRTGYRVTLAADGRAPHWQVTDAAGRVEILVEDTCNFDLRRGRHPFSIPFVYEVKP